MNGRELFPPLLKVIALIENKSGLIGRTVVHKCVDVWTCFDSAPLSEIGEEWKKKKKKKKKNPRGMFSHQTQKWMCLP
jgi:hypothetical protein